MAVKVKGVKMRRRKEGDIYEKGKGEQAKRRRDGLGSWEEWRWEIM